MKFYDIEKNRLIYFHKNVGNNLWNIHWLKYWKKLKSNIYQPNSKSLVCRITKKFLKTNNGVILEGGCGLGQNVYSLNLMKYDVIGIDYAKNIIKKINLIMPNLKIEFGDIRQIQYPDNFFSGYWSIGVIEHYFKGYNDILKEMERVIKPKGYLFLTFPYMSPFRKFKSGVNMYRIFNNKYYLEKKEPNNFYQYILDKNSVIKTFEEKKFRLVYIEPYSGLKGLKDELFFLKFFLKRSLQLLVDAENPKFIHILKGLIDKIFSKYFGHAILLIFQKI